MPSTIADARKRAHHSMWCWNCSGTFVRSNRGYREDGKMVDPAGGGGRRSCGGGTGGGATAAGSSSVVGHHKDEHRRRRRRRHFLPLNSFGIGSGAGGGVGSAAGACFCFWGGKDAGGVAERAHMPISMRNKPIRNNPIKIPTATCAEARKQLAHRDTSERLE